MNNQNVIDELYNVVKMRKEEPQEGSYTSYLFEQGLDKILKKCGEENAEMIIAAKNHDTEEIANEMCDLIYHMMVLLVESGTPLDKVMGILDQRSKKIGNLKTFHQVDRES